MKKILIPCAVILSLCVLKMVSLPLSSFADTSLDTNVLEGKTFVSAYHAFQAGKYDTAIKAFYQFTRVHPDSLLLDYAYFYMGSGMMKLGDYERAQKTFASLKKAYPQSLLVTEASFLEADTFFYRKNYDAAIQRYLSLKKNTRLKEHRLMPELSIKLGQCYEQKQQFQSAIETYHQAWFKHIYAPTYPLAKDHEERLLKQHPSLIKHFSTKHLFSSVEKLHKSGKAKDALSWIRRLQERALSPALKEKLALQQAYTYYLLRDNDRAKAYYRQFLRDYPKSKSAPYALDRIGRLYLRQNKMEAFLRIYGKLRATYPKSQYAASAMRLKGKEFVLQGKFKSALDEFNVFMKLYPKNSLVSDILWNIGWCHYQLQQYQAAMKTLDRLVRVYPKSYHKEEALYWAGRSAEFLKQYAKAATYYTNILKYGQNTYFGGLSQQAIFRIKQVNPSLKIQTQQAKKKPLPFDAVPSYTTSQGILHHQKSQELERIGLYDLAAQELVYAIEKDKHDMSKYLELARFYSRAGKYHELVRLMRRHFWYWVVHGDESLPQTFWEYVYPLSFHHIVVPYASSNQLDPLFVQSLMLAESAFDSRALSPVGAMGLMQLMPYTGRRLAREARINIASTEQFFEPEVNILLGTTYLKTLSRLFNEQLPPVIASYNAGEQRVRLWWDTRYEEDYPLFVGMIPYRETKSYVQKVLWYYQEYQRIYPQQ